MTTARKRRTPADDAQLGPEWREKHRYNVEELGLSNRRSYYRISEEYGCSWTTIRYHTHESARSHSILHKKNTYTPYAKENTTRINYRRTHSQIYSDIRRHPDIYLDEIFPEGDSFLTLDEITLRLANLTGINLRNNTLSKIVKQYEDKTGAPLLVEYKCCDPPSYHLF